MKVCKKCNKTYLDDSKFCEDCGAPLKLLQEIPEGKQVKKILIHQKLALVDNSERPKKVLPKPLKRVKPLVHEKAYQESEQNKGIEEILLAKFLTKSVTVVNEPKAEEPEQVVGREYVVEESTVEEFTHDNVQNVEQGKKKGIKLSLIFAAVGLLALIGVGLLFLFGAKSATYIKCKDSVFFQQEGGKYFLDIDTDGEFDVIDNLEWITTSVSEKKIEIICSSNKEGFMRSGVISLSYGSQSKSVEVIQKGTATYIKLSPNNLVFSSKGGTEKVVIDTDGSGLNVVGSGCEIKNQSESGFDVYVDSHSGAPRTGKITVFSGSVSTVMTFYQKGKCGRCLGSGKVVCSACSGSGKVQSWYNYGDACSVCAKSGSIICPDCSGTGEK